MKQHLCFILLAFTNAMYAQHTIEGNVADSLTGENLEMVTVRLFSYTKTDSVLVQGAQTVAQGKFVLSDINDGHYRLIVSSVGYQPYQTTVRLSGKDIRLNTIRLKEDILSLGEIQVTGRAAEMVVKGDTIEYNSNAYKTSENAMAEELLKKMPGMEIDKEGNITVNGESITAVRIDGKKFFGDDVQMATKNIPAEMIDKVQVIEEKSEMAKLTGFEDDDTERIINFSLKQSKKKGLFGNFSGSAGADIIADNGTPFGYDEHFLNNDLRYNANAFLNILLGETQTTLIGSANNSNEMRSGRGRSGMQGNGSGITRTENIGVNTNIATRKDLLIGADASLNHTNNLTLTESEKEQYADSLTYNNTDNQQQSSNTWDASVRAEFEWQIDSLNKLILRPTLQYIHSDSYSSNDYTYLKTNTLTTDTVSDGWQENTAISQDISAQLRLIYNHKFLKPGRTLTMQGNVNISNTTSDSYNYYTNNALQLGTTEIIDQHTLKTGNTIGYNFRLSYVEPLYRNRHFLETAVSFAGNHRQSDKNQYNLAADSTYSVYDSVYSNSFSNQFFSETLELNYRYKKEKIDLTLGMKINPSQTESSTVYGNDSLVTHTNYVWNFAPNAGFKYQMGKKQFIRIRYNGKTQQPDISQMEPVKDNSNAMSETVGNLNLKPAFTHSLMFIFSKYNQQRFSSIMTGLRASITKDALTGNAIYDQTGKRYQQTVNAQALPYSVSADFMYNTPIVQKLLHLNTRTALSYNQRIAYQLKEQTAEDINISQLMLGNESRTGNLRASENLSLRLTHDIVDAGLQGSIAYSRTENNLSQQSISHVIDWTVRADLTFHLPHQWTISTDCGYTARYGYRLDNVNEIMWNASIDKTWQNSTLSLKFYDMLNQKKNIVEIIGDDYIQYNKYNTLPTYFMLTYTYKLNRMGNLKAQGKAARMQERIEKSEEPPLMPPPPPPL